MIGTLAGVCAISACGTSDLPPVRAGVHLESVVDLDFERVRPIFNSRCIACHSCLESPCQFNLQSWQGLRRGAFHNNAYDGLRTSAVEPQRMFEDALSEQQWRVRGFVDVLDGAENSILMRAIRLANVRSRLPSKPVKESLICPQTPAALSPSLASELAMPYGLQPLDQDQQTLLNDWVAKGAKISADEKTAVELPVDVRRQVRDWSGFFNGSDLKSKIVARYLYEHLFLAHLYFKESPRRFFKLVRSSTSCDQQVTPIATRRPSGDPGHKEWFYCLFEDPATVVYKNHLPYELSATRLAWLKKNFFTENWRPTHFPSFDPAVAANPLVAFQEMPVDARFRFLLEDAQYEVMTFIKGPVCNGSFAVNSIQEQFYVFFMNPKSDLMVRYPDYAKRLAAQLILPGDLGSNLSFGKIASGYHDILQHRALARQELNRQLQVGFPKGLQLEDIWDGEGTNDNAVLTVFRNDDNAKVIKGARGDLAKTMFVLDYSTFERLVYNLVINFDTFDNVSHQMLTRLYMDILRMDAEDNFLQFLPQAQRLKLKNEWYKGLATKLKLDLLGEETFAPLPQGVALAKTADGKLELVQKLLFERLSEKVRGANDTLNWKILRSVPPTNPTEMELKRLTSLSVAKNQAAFSAFFPELSLLILLREGKPQATYSILRNREHENLSWILEEDSRLAPSEDTLTILPGVAGGYPNQYLVVEEQDLKAMADRVLNIKTPKQFREFLRSYGVSRMDPRFWPLYDFSNAELLRREPIEGGVLDLSRYSINFD